MVIDDLLLWKAWNVTGFPLINQLMWTGGRLLEKVQRIWSLPCFLDLRSLTSWTSVSFSWTTSAQRRLHSWNFFLLFQSSDCLGTSLLIRLLSHYFVLLRNRQMLELKLDGWILDLIDLIWSDAFDDDQRIGFTVLQFYGFTVLRHNRPSIYRKRRDWPRQSRCWMWVPRRTPRTCTSLRRRCWRLVTWPDPVRWHPPATTRHHNVIRWMEQP